MRTLYILRHAQAATPPGVSDRDRPLDETGRREARMVAGRLLQAGRRPDIVLCSPALRTRQTLAPHLELLPDLNVAYAEDIYLATVGALYEIIKTIDDQYESALLVGHNPAMHGIVQFLVGQGEPALLARVAAGYKTGWLSVIHCPGEKWQQVMPGENRLEDLLTGKEFT